jgi:GNAT superfamily N-acetyltransferase
VSELRFQIHRYADPEVRALLEEIQRFYVQRYGGPDDDSTGAGEFEPPNGVFLLGYLDDAVVVSGALRRRDADLVEIKRMWVAEAARGKGLARTMLAELERRARDFGARRVVLSTGYRQPEAIALYESSGYERDVERFGRYADQDGAVFFGKDLPT